MPRRRRSRKTNRQALTPARTEHVVARAPTRLRAVRPVLRSRAAPAPPISAELRHQSPIKIPIRTPAERLFKRWSPFEAAAVAFEIRCGRFQIVARSASGFGKMKALSVQLLQWYGRGARAGLAKIEAGDRLCPRCLCVVDGGCGCPAQPEVSVPVIPAAVAA